MKTLDQAIADNYKIASHITNHPGEYPNQFSGIAQSIAGVGCIVYSSGCIVTGDGHLPSDQMEDSRKALQEAYTRNLKIVELAKQYAMANAKALTPKLYTHDGHKFVRL